MPIDFEGLRAALAERYALDCELGHGTAATVYLAQDLKVGKKVAVKVLDPDLALVVRSERFLREMDYTAQLEHNHILAITDRDKAYDPRTGREILYYVTPYAEDGSLADRIARHGPLPVKDALDFAAEVADALEYAHGKGLIHRDIKPANILVFNGHVRVADFGIARTILAADERLTVTGGQMGTPAYMSPEQYTAHGIDHRVDLYALGCTLYEMLTGRLPFEGPTFDHIALQRSSGPAPLVGKTRRVPRRVERLVAKALAMKVEDRFATAAHFRAAIQRARRTALVPMYSAGGAAAFGAAMAIWGSDIWDKPTRVDSMTYAVLPVESRDTLFASRLATALRDALARWRDITVIDEHQLREVLPNPVPSLSRALANRTATRLRAGRYLRASASRVDDSVRIHVGLHNAAQEGVLIRERHVRVSSTLVNLDAILDQLIERVLFADSSKLGGSRSFLAREAHDRGWTEIRNWNLALADSAFATAVRRDRDYARAHLGLAQVRFWNYQPIAAWRSPAERALVGLSHRDSSDRVLATGLSAFVRGELIAACAAFNDLTTIAPSDFSVWFGLATCLARDNAVVRGSTASGWRFRTSLHRAIRAYTRALALEPSVQTALRAGAFEFVRERLMTGGNDLRFGRASSPRTQAFAANPGWEGDTLVLVPYPVADVLEARPWTIPRTHRLALQRQRELFRDLAVGWSTSTPRSSAAKEAIAVALEMLGDRSSLDTLQLARDLASTGEDSLRLAVSAVWAQLKFSVPLDVAGIRKAKALADSILATRARWPESPVAGLASVAALTGRAELAAELVQRRGERRAESPVTADAPSLLIYAALGGPVDSIEALAQRVGAAATRVAAWSDREDIRARWLTRAATLAFPHHRLSMLRGLKDSTDPLLVAQASLLTGDSAKVLRFLEDLKIVRSRLDPAELTMDALFPEAALFVSLGRTADANSWISPSLDGLAATAPQVFMDPARAACLVWTMNLRAELADRLKDRATAERWSRVVQILWSDAAASVRAAVKRQRSVVQKEL